jgi:hypothetical protein
MPDALLTPVVLRLAGREAGCGSLVASRHSSHPMHQAVLIADPCVLGDAQSEHEVVVDAQRRMV